ncbi:MAG TPA: hypothetical protein VFD71_09915, partial [Planctomycetota bacterium]|nr:hypothetical protein [Planctomycetota bacterium]
MKVFQTVLSMAVVVLLGALGYYFMASHSIDRTVGEQGARIEQVTQRTAKQEQAIVEQSKTLDSTRREVTDQKLQVDEHRKRIETLEKNLEETEAGLKKASEALEVVRGAAADNTQKIGSLES